MKSTRTICNKLIMAIHQKYDKKLLINYRQFYTKENKRLTIFSLQEQLYDEEKNKEIKIELYKGYNMYHIMFYLRDLWYTLNGWELPEDNTNWMEIRKGIDYELSGRKFERKKKREESD